MNLVQFLATCSNEDLLPIITFVKHGVLPIIQIGVPIILIIMGSIDLGRAVLSSDDKEIKGATSKLIRRAIAAVMVFFVATIVSLLMGLFAKGTNHAQDADASSWAACWDEA